MIFNRELISTVIPSELPPEEFVPLAAVAASEQFVNQPLLRRSYLWAAAILQAGLSSRLPVSPGLTQISAGILTYPPRITSGRPIATAGVGFGAYLLARKAPVPVEIQGLQVGDTTVPVVIVSGEVDLHGCPPHPVSGASTCWVK